jgi:hypothetical protein
MDRMGRVKTMAQFDDFDFLIGFAGKKGKRKKED